MITKEENKFKKDLEKLKKQDKDFNILKEVVQKILEKEPLPVKNKDHELKGKYKGFRECHIQPDWILIYYIKDDILYLSRTGSHSELF